MSLPWDRRLVAVLGKGGVGRTTIARSLAIEAGRRGVRTALVEVNGARSLADGFGVAPRQHARSVAAGVDLYSLSAAGCLQEYVVDRVKLGPLVGVVLRRRVIRVLIDAIPGMSDLLHLGKIDSLVDPTRPNAYDRVVIDAPATGHGLQFLETPAAMSEMTRRGPMFDESRAIADRLADPTHTAAVAVTLAEELPTTESLELIGGLGARRSALAAVIVNRVVDDPLPPEIPWDRLRAALDHPLVDVGDRLILRLDAQRRAIERLRDGLGAVPVGALPELDAPLDAGAIDGLASALARAFGAP